MVSSDWRLKQHLKETRWSRTKEGVLALPEGVVVVVVVVMLQW